jgi:hypothetical protein
MTTTPAQAHIFSEKDLYLGARHIPHYSDQHENYITVSPSILRELSTFGWLQEGLGAAGTFFFSGAFWLLVTLLVEHLEEIKKYAPWLMLCVISMIFGGILIWIGYSHFRLKQDRINDIFRPSKIFDDEA